MAKLKRRSHSEEFKREAVTLVTDQGYSVAEAELDIRMLKHLTEGNWWALPGSRNSQRKPRNST